MASALLVVNTALRVMVMGQCSTLSRERLQTDRRLGNGQWQGGKSEVCLQAETL